MTFTNSYTQPELICTVSQTATADIATTEIQERKPLLASFIETLAEALFRKANPDPTFHQVSTSSGDILWVAYDPRSRTTHQFDSEEMARTWVEQRHCAGYQDDAPRPSALSRCGQYWS